MLQFFLEGGTKYSLKVEGGGALGRAEEEEEKLALQFYIPHFYDFPFGLKEIDFGKQTTNCKLPSSCFTMFGRKAPLHERTFIGKVCLF